MPGSHVNSQRSSRRWRDIRRSEIGWTSSSPEVDTRCTLFFFIRWTGSTILVSSPRFSLTLTIMVSVWTVGFHEATTHSNVELWSTNEINDSVYRVYSIDLHAITSSLQGEFSCGPQWWFLGFVFFRFLSQQWLVDKGDKNGIRLAGVYSVHVLVNDVAEINDKTFVAGDTLRVRNKTTSECLREWR